MNQAFNAVRMRLEVQGEFPCDLACQSVRYQAKLAGAYELKVVPLFQAVDLVLNSPCVVKISSTRFEAFIFSGVLGGISQQELTIVPDCITLYRNQRSGIYTEATVLDLIDQSLKSVSLSRSLKADYPRQKSLTQFAEKDMQFITRQCAEYGIWSFFYQDFKNGLGVKMHLGDHNQAFIDRGVVSILADAQSEAAGIFNLEWAATDLADAVQGIHFVENDNDYLLCGEGGIQHHTLANRLSSKQLADLTDVAQAGIQGQQQILTAVFQGLNLQAGEKIQLDLEDGLQTFVIIEVNYDFNGQHQLKAAALFDLTGKELTYRAPIWRGAHRVNAAYVFSGLLSGCYGFSEGAVVVPDALGNVPVYFPYDYAVYYGNQMPACLTRIASWSNQGGQTGKTFPIYKDTELQMVFMHGNMDYPVIKGAAANRETGHVHNASTQRRTHWQLPQGQYLSYSNVPGDHNFIQLGAVHQENTQRSNMLLSNYRDPDQPGTKRLDYQQATTQSLERVTGQDYHSLQGGNLTVLDSAAKTNPLTYLVIQLGDQSNISAPDKPPALQTYLKTLLIDLSLEKAGQDAPLSYSGLSVNAAQQFKHQQVLEPNTNTLSQYGALTISLAQSQIILLNGQAVLPTDILTLQPRVWQKNKSTDQWGNIYYSLVLTVLAPPILFNFRQDVCLANQKLQGDDLTTYQILSLYFAADQDSLASVKEMRTAFTEDELDFWVSQGNNATFFIHGYNVSFGRESDPDDDLSASAAHQWFSAMECNLNIAAGFDGKDYTKYTRLIGIAWQGNPLSPVDFRVDYAMTQFPAERLLILLQQLSARGIAVNIMAHSCGNQVLLQALELAASAGIKINHSFMWEPAVADNALTSSVEALLPMEFQNLKGDYVTLLAPNVFPHAAQATEHVTVLYSDDDTILGSINGAPSQKTWTAEAIHDFYIGLFGDGPVAQAVKSIGHAIVFSLESLINPIWAMQRREASQTVDDPAVGNILHATKTDPGAGLFFAAPAEVIFLLDRYGMDHIRQQLDLISIYHLANLFVEPLSFFLASPDHITHFYSRWLQKYQTYVLPQKGQNQNTPFSSQLSTQQSILAAALPEAYNLLSVGMYLMLYLKSGVVTAIVDAIKNCPAVCDWKKSANRLFKAEDEIGEQAGFLATLMLSVILTDGVQIPPAMGYRGALGPYFNSSQKGPSGQDLCVDHSAMLMPTTEFMQYVYKGVLMNGSGGGQFQYFGKWKTG